MTEATDHSSGPDVTVDSRGKMCPAPVIELAKAVAGVPVGATVTVLADDPAAATDLPAWCRLRGQEYLGQESGDDGVPTFRVRRVS